MRAPLLAFAALFPVLGLACSAGDDAGAGGDDDVGGGSSGQAGGSSGAEAASSGAGPSSSSSGGGQSTSSSSGGGGAASSSSGGEASSSSSGGPAPSHDDGIQNGDETGIDCGGPTAPSRCEVGGGCAAGSDCSSAACAYDGKCVAVKSCVRHMGGDTCGAGETYEAGHQHESCCETIPVPSANGVKLDKYNITAGRMRAFVEATGANIKEWIQANQPAWWVADWTNYLPTGNDTPKVQVQSQLRNLGVYGQLGPAFVYDQAGDAGCWSGAADGEVGAPTYWIPTADRQALEADDVGSLYPQDMLDQKSLNCVNAVMVAAFCAWDGGRLPTIEELDAAWGPATYPWGEQAPAGYTYGYPNPGSLHPADGDPLRANYYKNYPQTDAAWQALQDAFQLPAKGPLGNDLAFYIAPPGRFPLGAGPFGHQDLAGNLFNVTSGLRPIHEGDSIAVTLQTQTRWSRSGSFETAHEIPYPAHVSPVLRKYWAQGGRCVKL